MRSLKKAGYFLPVAWGCVPQLYKIPQDWGISELIETIPAVSL
jgi:hypothetical protein